ncbi:MAG: hypothetical protein EVA87_02115 [Rhodospirillaceae bacterium]|nr:MAG: hypothetical protein EVA87_02115 [Rhodospirillaceae bacterium]
MRALKALVIGMAVLIFVGVVVLIVGIVEKAGEFDGEPPAEAAGFEEARIALPTGATVEETHLDGDRILVRLKLVDGTARLIVVSAATGKQTGAINLK